MASNSFQPRYEVYNKFLKRVVFQAPERKSCREWCGKNIEDPDLVVRKIK